ncbi:MAG: hypothetical protein IJA23_03265 [Clostridia bacterium]|nr:hypothetical protein [Clostridia bacterium]
MRKIKKHIGLILILVIVIAFPTSLSNQIKINMRVIVTGIAVDKEDKNFVVTAQIMKPSPGVKSSSESATIDYITDKSETLAGAISKLSFKAGKTSAFSHTNFVILGKDMLNEDVTESLDYFIRDKIIKNSALVLFAEEKASDEIKKTKNTDHSVGIGLQKVFLFKEHESDGVMRTMMEFLNENQGISKTSVVSVLSLKSNEESSSGSSEGSGSSSSGSSSGGSGGEGGSGESSGSSGSSSGSGGESQNQYFEQQSPLMLFVGGRYAGKLETENEISGFMFTNKESKAIDVMVVATEKERLAGSKVEINIKNMGCSKKLTFEDGAPVINIKVKIYNAEINEILNPEIIALLTENEYKQMKIDLENEIKKRVSACFEKSKAQGADIFEAYEKAYRFNNKKFNEFASREDFLKQLKLNVDVEVRKLDY